MAQAAGRGSSDELEIVVVDVEREAAVDAPAVQRQDSLYAAATRAAGANQHGQVRTFVRSISIN